MSKNQAALKIPQPLHKSITVHCPIDDAFDLFTNGLARWWPYKTYSVSQERTANCMMEGRPGGRVYERRDDGETFDWAKVLVWEPPRRLVLGWHPGRSPETAQEVEFRFTDLGDATRVDLEHRDWAKLGDEAQASRTNYEGGWDFVLEKYREAAAKGNS